MHLVLLGRPHAALSSNGVVGWRWHGQAQRLLLAAHVVLALLAVVHSTRPPADNYAVVVSSSRYWLNYRHAANALGVYQAIRR